MPGNSVENIVYKKAVRPPLFHVRHFVGEKAQIGGVRFSYYCNGADGLAPDHVARHFLDFVHVEDKGGEFKSDCHSLYVSKSLQSVSDWIMSSMGMSAFSFLA